MRNLILIGLIFVLGACANTEKGQWRASEIAKITPKEADSFCWELSQHEPSGFQDIRYNQCMSSKGLVYIRDSHEVKECKRQCKAEFRKISAMENQFTCLDNCQTKGSTPK